MTRKREIRAADVMKDIHGMKSSAEIMEKYRLSRKGLRSVFRKLVDARVLTKEDLRNWVKQTRRIELAKGRRRFPRRSIRFPWLVCDPEDSAVMGFVRDISLRGVGVEGIKAKVGEIRTLRLRSSELAQSSTFEFKVECRWINGRGEYDGEQAAGFEITSIDTDAFEELSKIV